MLQKRFADPPRIPNGTVMACRPAVRNPRRDRQGTNPEASPPGLHENFHLHVIPFGGKLYFSQKAARIETESRLAVVYDKPRPFLKTPDAEPVPVPAEARHLLELRPARGDKNVETIPLRGRGNKRNGRRLMLTVRIQGNNAGKSVLYGPGKARSERSPFPEIRAMANGRYTEPVQTVGGGVGGTHCMHVVDAKSASGSYQLFLQAPSAAEALWSVQSPAERGTPVPGLWSEAYVGPGSGGQFLLTALHRGDMAIEIHGPAKNVVIELGKLAVSRLK